MIVRIALVILLAIAPLQSDAATPVKARTLSGIGVVKIPAFKAVESVVLYKEPGLGQLQTLTLTNLPSLRLNGISLDRLYLPVMAKKRGWLKVVIDDSERTGWLDMRRNWEFSNWEHFLANRQVTMLKGIRKDFYLLRKEAVITSDPFGSIEKSTSLFCREINGDWALVESGSGVSGWLRWRDENGRLLLVADSNPSLP